MSYVYCGWLDSALKWILNNIISPVFNCIKSVLSSVFSFIYSNVLGPILDNTLYAAGRWIWKIILDSFFNALYSLAKMALQILDCLSDLFDTLLGVQPVIFKGEETTLLRAFLNMDAVRRAFWYINFFALGLAVIFAVYGVTRSVLDFDFENKRPVSRVMSSLLSSVLNLFTVQFAVFGIIYLAEAILTGLNSAMALAGGAAGNTTLGRMIFVLGTLNAANDESFNLSSDAVQSGSKVVGPTDEIRSRFFESSGLSPYKLSDVKTYFNIYKLDYIILIGLGLVFSFLLLIALIAVVRRLFNLLLLYIVSPLFAATIPLDDGEHFGKWRNLFVGTCFTGYGMLVAMKLYLLICPTIMGSELTMSSSVELNFVCKVVFLLGGLWAVYKSSSMITSLISAEAGSAEEAAMAKGTEIGDLVKGNLWALVKAGDRGKKKEGQDGQNEKLGEGSQRFNGKNTGAAGTGDHGKDNAFQGDMRNRNDKLEGAGKKDDKNKNSSLFSGKAKPGKSSKLGAQNRTLDKLRKQFDMDNADDLDQENQSEAGLGKNKNAYQERKGRRTTDSAGIGAKKMDAMRAKLGLDTGTKAANAADTQTEPEDKNVLNEQKLGKGTVKAGGRRAQDDSGVFGKHPEMEKLDDAAGFGSKGKDDTGLKLNSRPKLDDIMGGAAAANAPTQGLHQNLQQDTTKEQQPEPGTDNKFGKSQQAAAGKTSPYAATSEARGAYTVGEDGKATFDMDATSKPLDGEAGKLKPEAAKAASKGGAYQADSLKMTSSVAEGQAFGKVHEQQPEPETDNKFGKSQPAAAGKTSPYAATSEARGAYTVGEGGQAAFDMDATSKPLGGAAGVLNAEGVKATSKGGAYQADSLKMTSSVAEGQAFGKVHEQQPEPETDNKFGKSQPAAAGKTSPYAATSEARGAYTVGEGGQAAFDMDATSKPLGGAAGVLNAEGVKATSQGGAYQADSLKMTSSAAEGQAFGKVHEPQSEPGSNNKFGESQQAAAGKTSSYAATSEARGAYTVGEGGQAAFDMDATSKPVGGAAGVLNAEGVKATSQGGAYQAESLKMTSSAAEGQAFGKVHEPQSEPGSNNKFGESQQAAAGKTSSYAATSEARGAYTVGEGGQAAFDMDATSKPVGGAAGVLNAEGVKATSQGGAYQAESLNVTSGAAQGQVFGNGPAQGLHQNLQQDTTKAQQSYPGTEDKFGNSPATGSNGVNMGGSDHQGPAASGGQSYSGGRQTASTGTQTQEGGTSYSRDDSDYYVSSKASAYRSKVLNGSTRASNDPTIMNNEMSNGQGFSRNVAENSVHQTVGGQTTQTTQTTQTSQTNRTSTINSNVKMESHSTQTDENVQSYTGGNTTVNMRANNFASNGNVGYNNIHQSVNEEVGTGRGSYARDDTGFNYGNSGLNAYRNSSGLDSIDNPTTGSQYTYTQTVRTGVQQNAGFEKSESPVKQEVHEVTLDTQKIHAQAKKDKDKNDGNKGQGKK